MTNKTTSRLLKHKFSDEELLKMGQEFAESNRNYAETEKTKAAVTADLTAKLKRYRQDMDRLTDKIRDGYEFRSIECSVEHNWAAGKKELTRLDTGEVIVEPILPEERQTRLDTVN